MEIDPALIEKSGRTLEEIKELREIFHLVDSDGGGTISKIELEKLMKMVGVPANSTDIDVENGVILVIDDGDGRRFARIHTSITLKEMNDAFAVLDCYDACHDGTISMTMLQQAFTTFADNKMELADAKELISEVSPQREVDFFDYRQFLNIYYGK